MGIVAYRASHIGRSQTGHSQNGLQPSENIAIFHTNDDLSPHGLRTPNEGINQRYLKNWAEVADKLCIGRT